jgi:hypothetical protein
MHPEFFTVVGCLTLMLYVIYALFAKSVMKIMLNIINRKVESF